jgi:hypothetical protein
MRSSASPAPAGADREHPTRDNDANDGSPGSRLRELAAVVGVAQLPRVRCQVVATVAPEQP